MTNPNPYNPAASRLYYGRESLIRSLMSDEAAGQSVVLIGGRRCGKTRTLERIVDFLRATATGSPEAAWPRAVPDHEACKIPDRPCPPHWPTMINCQGQRFDSLGGFLAHVADEMAVHAPQSVTLSERPSCNTLSSAQFEAWLCRVDRAYGEARLGGIALLLDEVEELLAYPWRDELMSFLRRLDDFTLKTRLWLLLTGAEALDSYKHPVDSSPPLNTSRRTFLTDLDYRARRRMAVEPFTAAGRMPLPDVLLHQVDRCAAGNVWVLTGALEVLFAQDRPTLATLRDFEEAFLDSQADLFRRWSRTLEETSRSGWRLYQQVSSLGAIPISAAKGAEARRARQLLEFQSLVHHTAEGTIELGPDLFRHWALEEGKVTEPCAERPRPRAERASLPPGHFQYDVAISYASPQLELAKGVALNLQQLGLRVYFDRALCPDLWGVDLARHLPEVFDRESRLCVLLLSREYVRRVWPRLESRVALARAIREGWGAVVLVTTDGELLPPDEVPQSVVWLDVSGLPNASDTIAVRVRARLNGAER